MRRNTKLITTILAMVMVLPFFLGLGSAKDVMATDSNPEPEVTEQKVTLHKRLFDNVAEKNEENADTWGTPNTGDEMKDFGGDPLAGAVFEAYDVTATYWAAYDTATGTDAAKTKAAQASVDALSVTALTKFATFGPTSAMEGTASETLPTKSGGRNAIYLFHETVSPAGVVQSKSVDFILGLPVYDEGGDNVKKEVHIYPKNEVKAVTFGFTKFGVDETGVATELPGANFILKGEDGYYNDGAFGSLEGDAEIISSGERGLVTVDGLTLNPGTYEFYEVNSTVSTDGSEEAEYHYGKNPVVIVTVDENMNVTYDYYNIDGKMTDETKGQATGAKAYNYKVPAPTKVVDDKDVDVDQEIIFTITQKIPTDIADYKEFKLVDNYDDNLQLLSTKEDIEGQLEAYGATFGENGIPDDSSFNVEFNVANLKEHAGETITFEVKMSVKKGADLATDINNEVTFENNFADKSANDSVKTYGKRFVKVDLDSKATLAGAKFYVKKVTGVEEDKEEWYLGTRTIDGVDKQAWAQKTDAGKFETGFAPTVLESGPSGIFSVAGLAWKDGDVEITYELEEFVAPDGYALLKGGVPFKADASTSPLEVANKHKGSLPSTGGSGIVAFVLIGVVAVGGAVLYFTKGRRQIEG